jgi:hypothetical protein
MWRFWPLFLVVSAGPVSAQAIGFELTAKGAVAADVEVSHAVDAAHFCSAAADPWAGDRRVDIRPSPFPFYRVVFGQAGPAAELERPGPSLGIALSHWAPPGGDGWVQDHEDPLNDTFELVLQGRLFVGHPGQAAPVPRLQFAWRDDGRGGGFLATGLQEIGGDGRLTVEGSWSCPAIDTALPEVAVRAHRLFRGAVSASAAPPRLAYSLHREGELWRAAGPDGTAFVVAVDLRPLRLAPLLRGWAEAGKVVLLVNGEVRNGVPPRMVVRGLNGVMPAPP